MTPSSPVLPGLEIEETVIAKDQPEYNPLPAVIVHHDPQGKVLTRWALTDDERLRIASGEDLYLCVLTFGDKLQPVWLAIARPDEVLSMLGLQHIDGDQCEELPTTEAEKVV